MAHHRRRNGRSEFIVASNMKGIMTTGTDDDSLIGHMTANFIGSKYHIWDQVFCVLNSYNYYFTTSLLQINVFHCSG